MLDTTTGEIVNLTLTHEGDNVREFYSKLSRPVRVGIEATGSMHWFLEQLLNCQSDVAKIAWFCKNVAGTLLRAVNSVCDATD